jgi:hypothetical protein
MRTMEKIEKRIKTFIHPIKQSAITGTNFCGWCRRMGHPEPREHMGEMTIGSLFCDSANGATPSLAIPLKLDIYHI